MLRVVDAVSLSNENLTVARHIKLPPIIYAFFLRLAICKLQATKCRWYWRMHSSPEPGGEPPVGWRRGREQSERCAMLAIARSPYRGGFSSACPSWRLGGLGVRPASHHFPLSYRRPFGLAGTMINPRHIYAFRQARTNYRFSNNFVRFSGFFR